MLVGNNSGAGAESCVDRKGLLYWGRCLLQIFGWGICRFGIFGLVSMSVEDIDSQDWSPGAGMYFGRLGLSR